jgi:hypothetical protein
MPTEKRVDSKQYRVAWDSCCFIHRMQRTANHIKVLEQITYAAESGTVIIVCSAMAIAEVVKIDAGEKPLTPKQAKQIKAFFENDFIDLVAIDRFVGEMASDFVRGYGIKPPDAVHIASAIIAQVPVFQTYDDKLLNKNGKIPGVSIERPTIPGEQPSYFATQS